MKRGPNTMQEPEDTRLLIRYLLDDLEEEEQEKIEERDASDDSFYLKLLATEDELIDSYVLGEISPEDRKKFEQAYLGNPHRRKKVEANELFLELVTNRPSPTPWYVHLVVFLQRTLVPQNLSFKPKYAAILLFGVLCGSLSGWFWKTSRMRDELAQANSQWRQMENAYLHQIEILKQSDVKPQPDSSPRLPNRPEVNDPGKKETKAHSWPSIVSFVVPRGPVRTPTGEPGALKPLVIWHGAGLVRLTVDLEPNDYSEYTISLQKIGDTKFWNRTLSKNQPGFSSGKIVITVPADFFGNEDYILKVSAYDPLDSEQILAFHSLTVINENLVQTNIERTP
jgi:hypothetical protein